MVALLLQRPDHINRYLLLQLPMQLLGPLLLVLRRRSRMVSSRRSRQCSTQAIASAISSTARWVARSRIASGSTSACSVTQIILTSVITELKQWSRVKRCQTVNPSLLEREG